MKRLLLLTVLIVSQFAFSLTLRVGVYNDRPLTYVKNGSPTGIYIDVLNYIARKEDWKIQYVVGTLKDLLDDLKDGKIDLLTSVAYTPQRAQYAYFGKEDVYVNWAEVCQRKNEHLQGFYSLRGKRIGVMAEDIYYTGPNGIKNLLDNFGVSAKFVEFPDYKSVLKAVKDGIVDAGVVTRLYVEVYGSKYDVKGTPIIFYPVKLVFAATKKKPKLLGVLNTIDDQLREMKGNNSSEYYKIISKYTSYSSTAFSSWFVKILLYSLIIAGASAVFLVYLSTLLRRKITQATKKLVDQNRQLEAANKRLLSSEIEMKKAIERESGTRKKYAEIINLLSSQSDLLKRSEEFFMSKILSAALVILDGDYGSVSKEEKGKWIFVASVGHDGNYLNTLNLDATYMLRMQSVDIVNVSKYNKKILPPQIMKRFVKGTKAIKESIFMPLTIGEQWRGSMSIDIAEKSEKRFTDQDLEVAKAFQEVAKSFLSVKMHNELFKEAYIKFARRLASIAESYDQTTGWHIVRVGEISAFVAEKMGLDEKIVKDIKEFAPLHDIGKILIAKEILKKPGKLSPQEWEEMKKHTLYSQKILDMEYFDMASKIALYHHENYDGSGYPYGLSGEEIPLEAQIVHLVDVYDALRSNRPYKKAFNHEETIEVITKGDGRTSPKHFHPKVLEVFLNNAQEISNIFEKFDEYGQI